ncbi:L,D-transpeptidase [Desulfotruncus alcoholivorax]|uniref:L,D-transpeptidase n=1 Tax=Desulfotruncus alcoholivorax TaxID=265477 RepID=UPI00041F3066|nr:L,D-transpeptidase [Desulfotruncus alcoholivorax]
MARKSHTTLILCLAIFFSLAGPAAAKTEIIINKATNKLYFNSNDTIFKVFPVATGRTPALTPEGQFSIVVKLVNPAYYRLNIPGGSPRNPLGYRWLGLSVGGGGVYGIHGTNNPASIGTYASGGCIRMHNQDVTWLFDHTPLGTPVKIINNPNLKPAWEVQQPAVAEASKKDISQKPSSRPAEMAAASPKPAVSEKPAAIEKPQVNQALQIAGEATGQVLLQSGLINRSNIIVYFATRSIIKELAQQQ